MTPVKSHSRKAAKPPERDRPSIYSLLHGLRIPGPFFRGRTLLERRRGRSSGFHSRSSRRIPREAAGGLRLGRTLALSGLLFFHTRPGPSGHGTVRMRIRMGRLQEVPGGFGRLVRLAQVELLAWMEGGGLSQAVQLTEGLNPYVMTLGDLIQGIALAHRTDIELTPDCFAATPRARIDTARGNVERR